MYRLAGIFAAFIMLLGAAYSPAAAQDKTVTVFAAASMKNALDDIDAAYTAKSGVKITVSFGDKFLYERYFQCRYFFHGFSFGV